MSFAPRRILAALFLGAITTVGAYAGPLPILPGPPKVEAKHYILIDPASGQILAEYQADEAAPPASLTKMLTAYLTFDALASGRLTLDQKVPVSVEAWKAGGSTMFLQPNLPVTVEQLISGMVVVSGNDAAITIADAIAGNTDTFVQMMNATAKQLGMSHSRFSNVNGLPPAINLVSARDIGLLAEAIERRFPQYMHYFAEQTFTYNHITQRNWNPLVFSDATVDGMKTGHTDEAGYCLVATANRNHRPLIAVVMGSDTRADSAHAAEALLDYGYRFFETRQAYKAGQVLATVRDNQASPAEVKLGVTANTYVTVPIGRFAALKPTLQLPEHVQLPLKPGQAVGKLVLSDDQGKEAEVTLVALEPVAKANWLVQAWNYVVGTVKQL